jgi:hypothetical protein
VDLLQRLLLFPQPLAFRSHIAAAATLQPPASLARSPPCARVAIQGLVAVASPDAMALT